MPMVSLVHMLMIPLVFALAVVPQPNVTFLPEPVLLPADPDLVIAELEPSGRAHLAGKPDGDGGGSRAPLNLIASRAGAADDAEVTLELVPDASGGGVTVTAHVLAGAEAALSSYSVFRLTSHDGAIKHCVPFAAGEAAVGAGADAGRRSAHLQHLPLSAYCVQLGCSCLPGRPCRRRPTRCTSFPHRAGVDMSAWRRTSSVAVHRRADTDVGPAVSVSVRQTGFRFDSFNVSVLGCRAEPVYQTTTAADQWLQLDGNCSIVFNSSLLMQVVPDTWFCAGGTGGCRDIRVQIGPLQRLPPAEVPLLRAAAPPGWQTATLALLAFSAAAVSTAGLLWSRRRHRRHIARAARAAACRRLVADQLLTGPRVLLLHLARSDAERAALRQLTDELRQRGATVVDSAAPEWRRAVRSDTAALASAVSCADRVLLLSSPAVAAAVAAGGGRGEPERQLAAAARQLAAGRLASDYGRLYQARLTADAPTLAAVVPGAAYTLPEHQRELVAAMLTGPPLTADTSVAELAL